MTIRTFELIYPKQIDDKRKITAKMIDEIIANSVDELYPVSIGHDAAMGYFGDDKPAAGRFNGLKKDENGMLLGDVALRSEADKDFKDGAYPGWSVGIFQTKKDGWKMDHLALLGSVGAAFKDLKEVNTNFSIIDQSEHCMEIECFNADKSENKTLWLLQCVPKQPATVETPAASFSAPDEGDQDMDAKEFEAYKAKQEKEKAERDRQFAALQADNEKLKADNQARLDAEINRRNAEFTGIKEGILKAAADKGVNEPTREALSAALAGYDAHYGGGVVSKELFDAFKNVLEGLKPKVDPGELSEHDEADDEFVPKQKFSGREAVDHLLN